MDLQHGRRKATKQDMTLHRDPKDLNITWLFSEGIAESDADS